MGYFFFFSSRRRHTRCSRDWSSDVCSSDLLMRTALEYARTFGVPVADHCEEPTLAAGGVMHEGLVATRLGLKGMPPAAERSEEHTSELQSRLHLVCRLLLEKKKT